MDKYAKLRIFELIGVLPFKFDFNTNEFRKSNYLFAKSCLVWFLMNIIPIKFYLSSFFERENPIQLFIGSIFNFVPDRNTRFFLGLIGKLIN